MARSYAGAVQKDTRSEYRVCQMCAFTWVAERSTRRSDRVKCPKCLSNQSDDLTMAEYDEMKRTYMENKEERKKAYNAVLAKRSDERREDQGGYRSFKPLHR